MEEPQPKKKRFNPGWFLINHLRRKLGAGLLVVIPIGITLFILRFLFNLADGVLAPYIQKTANFFLGNDYRYIPGLGMIAGLLVLYVSGVVASNVFGSRMVHFGESIMARIPLVKSIYTSSKQFIHVFTRSGKNSFRQAVYVEFPMEGSFAIAFITNSVSTASGKTYYTVFIPTSPNPTSGYVLILEEHRIYPTSFSVEEAMKVIMSGGVVAPETIKAEKLQ